MLSFRDIDFIALFYSFSGCWLYFSFVEGSSDAFADNYYMLLDTYSKLGR